MSERRRGPVSRALGVLSEHGVVEGTSRIFRKLVGLRPTPRNVAAETYDWASAIPAPEAIFDGVISVVTPVFNTAAPTLRACVESVLAQSWPAWELVIFDDGSTRADTADALRWAADVDDRIRVVRGQSNRGIVAATNAAIEAASGEWVVFLDHDDELAPHALAWLASAMDRVDLVYTDEVLIGVDGSVRSMALKPAWDPRLLWSHNYVTHLTAVRCDVLDGVGRLWEGTDGAQDHDLLLRLAERPLAVAHVPLPLYRWRMEPGSTAADPAAKGYAERAGRDAVQRQLDRLQLPATPVADRPTSFHYSLEWGDVPDGLIKIVVPIRDKPELLEALVAGLDRTVGVSWHLVVVDNGSVEEATARLLDELDARGDVDVLRMDEPFNFSRLCNGGAAHGPDAEFLLFLNNDIEVLHTAWLRQLVGWLSDPDVVAVGPMLLFDDRTTIQHAGVSIGSGHFAWNAESGTDLRPRLGSTYDCAHAVSALTAACLLVRTDAFIEAGRFDEELAVDYQDVDLCLRLGALGVLMYEPRFPLVHLESATRALVGADSAETHERIDQRWPGVRETVDMAFHPLAIPPAFSRVRPLATVGREEVLPRVVDHGGLMPSGRDGSRQPSDSD